MGRRLNSCGETDTWEALIPITETEVDSDSVVTVVQGLGI
jgi:hypothetical protein